MFKIFRPFDWKVWIMLVVFPFLTGVLFWLFEHSESKSDFENFPAYDWGLEKFSPVPGQKIFKVSHEPKNAQLYFNLRREIASFC